MNSELGERMVNALVIATSSVTAITDITKITMSWLDGEMSSEVAMSNIETIIRKVANEHG